MYLNKLALIIFFLFTTFSLLAQQAFEKSISTPGGFEVYSISNTDDNGFAITGKKGNGVLLIKFDSLGNLEWERLIIDSVGGVGTGTKIIQTQDKGFLISGYIALGIDPADIVLIKTDSLGNVLWYKTIGTGDIDEPSGMIESSSGYFYITGESYSMGPIGGIDAILLKVDNNGNLLFAKAFGGTNNDVGRKIIELTNKLLIFGTGSSFTYGNNMYLTDTMGNILFAKSFQFGSIFSDVAMTPDSAILLAGISYDNLGSGNDTVIFLVKMDTSGNQQWIRTFHLDSQFYLQSVKILSDGDVAILGNYRFNTSFLLQTDSLGNFKWAKSFGYSFNNFSNEIIKFANNDFLILASKKDSSLNQKAIYLIRTDSSGATNCSSDLVITSDTAASVPYLIVSPTETSISNLLISNPGISIVQSDTALFTCPLGTNVSEIYVLRNVITFPNPFNSTINLNFSNDLQLRYIIQIFDQIGILRYSTVLHSEFSTLNLDYLKSGLYTMKISFDDGYIVKKIFKVNY